ncbi:MAG TPA: hypothetical protein DDZ81_10710 [Acetobacteraceae bacterium]|nr:hypothetical protein [Acetobacteraceae bacterium]
MLWKQNLLRFAIEFSRSWRGAGRQAAAGLIWKSALLVAPKGLGEATHPETKAETHCRVGIQPGLAATRLLQYGTWDYGCHWHMAPSVWQGIGR